MTKVLGSGRMTYYAQGPQHTGTKINKRKAIRGR